MSEYHLASYLTQWMTQKRLSGQWNCWSHPWSVHAQRPRSAGVFTSICHAIPDKWYTLWAATEPEGRGSNPKQPIVKLPVKHVHLLTRWQTLANWRRDVMGDTGASLQGIIVSNYLSGNYFKIHAHFSFFVGKASKCRRTERLAASKVGLS